MVNGPNRSFVGVRRLVSRPQYKRRYEDKVLSSSRHSHEAGHQKSEQNEKPRPWPHVGTSEGEVTSLNSEEDESCDEIMNSDEYEWMEKQIDDTNKIRTDERKKSAGKEVERSNPFRQNGTSDLQDDLYASNYNASLHVTNLEALFKMKKWYLRGLKIDDVEDCREISQTKQKLELRICDIFSEIFDEFHVAGFSLYKWEINSKGNNKFNSPHNVANSMKRFTFHNGRLDFCFPHEADSILESLEKTDLKDWTDHCKDKLSQWTGGVREGEVDHYGRTFTDLLRKKFEPDSKKKNKALEFEKYDDQNLGKRHHFGNRVRQFLMENERTTLIIRIPERTRDLINADHPPLVLKDFMFEMAKDWQMIDRRGAAGEMHYIKANYEDVGKTVEAFTMLIKVYYVQPYLQLFEHCGKVRGVHHQEFR